MSARFFHSSFLAIAIPASLSLATACATGKSTHPGGGDQPDAGGGSFADAGFRADAAPSPDGGGGGGGGPVTLSQSSSMDVVGGNSDNVICVVTAYPGGPVIGTAENFYYRAFDLTAAGVTGDLAISKVSVGIEDAESQGGTQPASVALYTLNGAFTLANLTQLASTDVNVSDVTFPGNGNTGGTVLDIPITATAPAGSTLVVEFHIPDGSNDGNFLEVGSNTAAQTGPTYFRAPSDGCDITEPTDASTIDGNMHWVMTVTGQD